MELTKERRLEILKSLGATKCEGCGKTKRPKMSHCRVCYFRLPKALQTRLYKPFGNGYEEAFEESLAILKQ